MSVNYANAQEHMAAAREGATYMREQARHHALKGRPLAAANCYACAAHLDREALDLGRMTARAASWRAIGLLA